MRSLKGTLYQSVIMGTAVVLLAAGIILYLSVRAQLLRQMDDSLTDKARSLSQSVEFKSYGLEVDLEEMRIQDMEEFDTPEYLYIGTPGGRTIYRSELLEEHTLSDLPSSAVGPHHGWYTFEGLGKVRSVLISFQPGVDDEEEEAESVMENPGIIIDKTAEPGDNVVIQLLKDSSGHRRFMEMFLIMLLATGLGSIGVLSLTIWMAIKRGAEPINKLAASIEAIGDDDLAVRVDERQALRELAPVIHKFNLFLDRLEDSFNRERGFTSDAAHELRTPLAGLKSTIEVALARERESEHYKKTLISALQIVNQLENLVNSLLALARLESGQETAKGAKILLEKRIQDAWLLSSDAARKKNLKTSFNIGNHCTAMLDGQLISQILEELFSNAVYYADEGGTLDVNLVEEDGGIRLKISNTGSKVSAKEGVHVSDRFWRGSHSRDDTGVRFGLGLAIVRKIVDTMSLQMEIQTEMDGEFVVTLTIPGGDRS